MKIGDFDIDLPPIAPDEWYDCFIARSAKRWNIYWRINDGDGGDPDTVEWGHISAHKEHGPAVRKQRHLMHSFEAMGLSQPDTNTVRPPSGGGHSTSPAPCGDK